MNGSLTGEAFLLDRDLIERATKLGTPDMVSTSDAVGDIPGYLTANIVLNAVLALPMFVLWIYSFPQVSGAHDPARTSFVWMKVALPLFAM